MSEGIVPETHPRRRIGRSIGAVLAGMVAGVVATLVTDIVLHKVGVFPPWGESMLGFDRALLLATTYRTVYGVAASYTSLQGSRRIGSMGHALVGGGVGLAVSIPGVLRRHGGPAFGPH